MEMRLKKKFLLTPSLRKWLRIYLTEEMKVLCSKTFQILKKEIEDTLGDG